MCNSLCRLRFLLEKYNPPANVTIHYNGSCHVIRWDNPETRFEVASHMLYYELDIQSEVGTLPLMEVAQAPSPRWVARGAESSPRPPRLPRVAAFPRLCREAATRDFRRHPTVSSASVRQFRCQGYSILPRGRVVNLRPSQFELSEFGL